MINRKEDVTPLNMQKELDNLAQRLNLKDIVEAKRFPKYFQLETSRVCNAKCVFCPVDVWNKDTPFMKDDLFEKCAVEIGQHSDWVEWVNISRAGEPLLDRKIVKRVARLKELGVKNVNLSTNASRLFPEVARGLIDAGLDEIWLSIDSVHPENYVKTRVGLKYEDTIANIKEMFRLRNELKPEMMVRVRGVATMDLESEEGRNELAYWETFWSKYREPHDRIYMKQPHNWGNQKDMESVYGEDTADYGEIYHPCILPFSTMHITAMGEIALCAMDYDAKAKLGNVQEKTIKEVWNNENFSRYRDMHATGKRNEEKMCVGCKLFDLDFSIENKEYDEYAKQNLESPPPNPLL